jgi:CRP/FNR family transcriptional regulator, cyclic AMP receptor protein
MKVRELSDNLGAVRVLERSGLLFEADTARMNILFKIGIEVEYEPGEVIIFEGQEAEKLYVIEEGLVAIILGLVVGQERRIQTASNSDVIGWSAIVPPYRHRFMVRAIEKTKVLAFDSQELRRLMRTDWDLGYSIYTGITRVIADRLDNTLLQLIGIT